jgi:predicted ribosomally synthesized peptide with SipW-like signal peptide
MNRKKALVTIAASGLVAAMALGGSLAYLTDNESHTNTVMMSGNIRIDLVEEHWSTTDTNNNGVPDKSEEAVPNQEIPKDPKVINTGENPSFVFLRMSVPVKDVTRVRDDGTLVRKDNQTNPVTNNTNIFHEPQDLFYFKNSSAAKKDHKNTFNPDWIRLTNKEYNTEMDASGSRLEQEVGQAVYVFGWKDVLPANGEETGTLYDKIQLKNILEFEIQPEQLQNIKLEAFGIQADNLLDRNGNEIPTTSSLTQAQLEEIYDIFVKQNGSFDDKGNFIWNAYQDEEHGQTEKEADINNERDLINDDSNRQATTFQNNKVTLINGKATLKVGQTVELHYDIDNTVTDTGATYESSNPEVASVDEFGKITANKIGDATVTVKVTGNNGKVATASVKITVVNDSRDQVPVTNVTDNDNSVDPSGTTQP